MTELLTTVNSIREDVLATHYNAASAELKDKITAEPLRTCFEIYSGCVSEEIAKEIAHRFNQGGTKAAAGKYGLLFKSWYLAVQVDLPENLIREEPTPVEAVLPTEAVSETDANPEESQPIEN